MQDKNCYNLINPSILYQKPYLLVRNNGIAHIEFSLTPFEIPHMALYLSALKEVNLDQGRAEFNEIQIIQDNYTVRVCLATSFGANYDSNFLLKIMNHWGFVNTTPLIPELQAEPKIPVSNKRSREEEKSAAAPISVKKTRRKLTKINWGETSCMPGELAEKFIMVNPVFKEVAHSTVRKHFENFFRGFNLHFTCSMNESSACILVDKNRLAALKKENPDFDLCALLRAECDKPPIVGANKKAHFFDNLRYYHYRDVAIIECPEKLIQSALAMRLSRRMKLGGFISMVDKPTGNSFMLYLNKPLPGEKSLLKLMYDIGFNPSLEIQNEEIYSDILAILKHKKRLILPYYINYSPISDNEVEITSDLLSDNETLVEQLNRIYRKLTQCSNAPPFVYSIKESKLRITYDQNDTVMPKLLSRLNLTERAPAPHLEITQNNASIETGVTGEGNNSAYEEMKEQSPSLDELCSAAAALQTQGFFRLEASAGQNKNLPDNGNVPGFF